MKIDYVIMSSDSNPLYLDFWEIVSKIWKTKFNITPILFYIDNNQDIKISEEYGIVLKYKPIKDIPIPIQNLWIRYWAFILYPDSVCMISDIDMIPLSKEYFIDNIQDIDENKYIHINPCIESYGTLPSCYHICKGNLFKNILNLHENWEDSIKYLCSLKIGDTVNGINEWYADERYSSKKILEYENKEDIVLIKREGDQNGRRIDRINWNYSPELVKKEYYYDSHSIRPYNKYKKEIDKLIDLIS